MTPIEKLVAKHWGLPTLIDIAEQAGVRPNYVCRIGKRLGLPPRKRGPQRPLGAKDAQHIADVRRHLEDGETVTAIAAHYGISKQAVSQLARYHGFPIRELRRRQRSAVA